MPHKHVEKKKKIFQEVQNVTEAFGPERNIKV